jgi:hypothetical protein
MVESVPAKAVQKCTMITTEIQSRQALFATMEITRKVRPANAKAKAMEHLHHGRQPENLPQKSHDHNGSNQMAGNAL